MSVSLPDADATARLASELAPRLTPGDTLLLSGEIGAGKTHFARSIIQSRLARSGRLEDVPSPTFTLVQVYSNCVGEIWHADLYRLNSPDEAAELGLEEAVGTAIVIIEWPDRLGDAVPEDALWVEFQYLDKGRVAHLSSNSVRWATVIAAEEGEIV